MSDVNSLKNDGQSLSQIFKRGWKEFLEIENSTEPSNSEGYQSKCKLCIETFIRCTHMVNILGLFSSNEHISEVSTESLSFLLLPAFLGELSLKLMSGERKSSVSHALVYFRSFLKHCHKYKVIEKDLLKYVNETDDNDEKPIRNQTREEKIERYKECKYLENIIKTIEEKLDKDSNTVDESITRDHYLNWMKLWINKSIDNIAAIKSELEILEHMDKLRKGTIKPEPPKEKKPFKPVLITREMMMNQVFGAGYKSLPTMTEDEYFKKEIREGKIVLDYDGDSSKSSTNKSSEGDKEEKEGDDEHNEEKLLKARQWDEWKDTHRRGEGNKERNG